MSQNVFLLLPDGVYQGAVELARKRGTTLSALLVEALSDTVDQQSVVYPWPDELPSASAWPDRQPVASPVPDRQQAVRPWPEKRMVASDTPTRLILDRRFA